MRNYIYIATIAVATVIEAPLVPKGRVRHQLDFSGNTGSVTVEADFGTGYRTIETIDCTDTARVPYCLEAAVLKFRLTPSASKTMSYHCSEVL